MKIGIDLRPLYTGSRYRGIGVVAKRVIQELLKLDREGEFHFLNLYGDFPEGLELDERCYVHSYYNGPTVVDCGERKLYRVPELEEVREAQVKNFLDASEIDIMLFTSPNEYGNPFRIEWFQQIPTASVVYDLIPLLYPEQCLFDPQYKKDYMDSLEFLKGIDTLFAISETTKSDVVRHLNISSDKIDIAYVGLDDSYLDIPERVRRNGAKLREKYGDYFLFAGGIDFKKNIELIIEAYGGISARERKNTSLVIVGKLSADVSEHYESVARKFGVREMHITGFVSDEELQAYYCGAAALVFPSLYEGFGLPVIEAMACGTPVITSNSSSLREIAQGHALLVDPKSAESIRDAMEHVLADPANARKLAEGAVEHAQAFTWKRMAETVYAGLQDAAGKQKKFSDTGKAPLRINDYLLRAIADAYRSGGAALTEQESRRITEELSALEAGILFPAYPGGKRILLDLTVAHTWLQNQYVTGIGRVCLELYYALRKMAEVVAVSSEARNGKLVYHPIAMENNYTPLEEEIELSERDVLLMPEFQLRGIQLAKNYPHTELLREKHIPAYAVIHDILPLRMPQYFEDQTWEAFPDYLRDLLTDYYGILTVSRSVADDVLDYCTAHPDIRPHTSRKVGYFHNGISTRQQTEIITHIPEDVREFFSEDTFLMVGSIEPRKGHVLVLDTFERLWKRGSAARLCLIGRLGWNMLPFVERVKSHPEHGKHLLFLEGASDDVLRYAYKNSAALIQASAGEGFGLPLIEAGSYGLPVICSDIPVFHEVAEDHALYFDRETPETLEALVESFAELRRAGKVPSSGEIRYQSWDESARQIANMIIGDSGWYRIMAPDGAVSPSLEREERYLRPAWEMVDDDLENASGEKAVLLVHPNNFLRGGQGENLRTLSIVRILKQLGFAIDLLSFENFNSESTFKNYSKDNAEGLIRNLYLYDFKKDSGTARTCIARNHFLQDWTRPGMLELFDKALFEHEYKMIGIFYTYLSNLLYETSTDAQKIYFMEDSMFLQQKSWGTEATLGQLLDEELEKIGLFDEFFCISYDEKIMYEKLSSRHMNFLPHLMPETQLITKSLESRKWDVAFVGANNPFNVEGMHWFVDQVCPMLDQGIRVVLVGKMTTDLKRVPEGIDVIPFAEDMDALLEDVKISVCPMFRGTGMKIKVVEAMAKGLPIVCNERGVDGLPDKRACGCLVTNDAAEFAGYINKLVSDQEFYEQSRNRIISYYKQVFEKEQYLALLEKVLAEKG